MCSHKGDNQVDEQKERPGGGGAWYHGLWVDGVTDKYINDNQRFW